MGNEKYLNMNNRDVNADQGVEDAQGYLSEFSESDCRDGERSKPMGVVFGKEAKIMQEKVVEMEDEQEAEDSARAKGPLGRDIEEDDGVY